MPGMEIQVGADVSGLTGNLAKGESSIKSFGVAANKLGSSASAMATGLDKAKVGSNQAAFALTNLGRVAQDAPFGFIGIQNNLNPLLESFQRLRAESGSNAAALKALGASLMGPAGIGIALSVVSSAILLYQKYAGGATEKTEEHNKAIKMITTSYDLFLQELEKTSAAAGQEAAKVAVLFGALGDANISLKERKTILGQLNEISPAYLGSLDKEKASYEQISKAILNYTDSLAISAEVKALMPEVDKLFQGLIRAQIDLNQLRRFGTDDKNFFGLNANDFSAEEKRLNDQIKSFTNQIQIAKKGLNFIAGGPLSLSNILFGKNPEKEAKDTVEKVAKEVKRLAYSPAIGLKMITSAQILLDQQAAEKEINDKLGKVKMTPIKLNLDPTDIYRKMIELAKFLDQQNQQIADNVKSTFNSALSGIGESLAEALTGGKDLGQTIFGNFFKVIGAGLKQMGEAMIAIGTAKIALEKFKFAPGIGTVVAGIAAVAIGSIIQNAIPKFATGTQNFRGGMAMVGERGPELVNLPKGAGVIPNDKLGAISGQGMQVMIPDIQLRGQDLVIVFNRASRSNNRSF